MNELVEILKRGANEIWTLGLTDDQFTQFARYAELLVEWNANINLTRLTTPREIAVKHFLDSLAVMIAVRIPENAFLIDIGTGAGFPGLALKIARPDLRVTLLDGTAKKLAFCQAVAEELELRDVQTLHGRAEDAARMPEQRGKFDVVTARAVAPLVKLLPWAAPWMKPGGQIVALKGVGVDEELAAARPMARGLGLTLTLTPPFSLPEAETPTLRRLALASRSA